jgi:hypothetical protein
MESKVLYTRYFEGGIDPNQIGQFLVESRDRDSHDMRLWRMLLVELEQHRRASALCACFKPALRLYRPFILACPSVSNPP